MLKIYHNNKCSKSRYAKEALNLCELPFDTVEYLSKPLDFYQLKDIFNKMEGTAAQELCREKLANNATDDEILQYIAENPEAMQRPILETDKKAIIARNPEVVNAFLEEIKNHK